MAVNWPDIALQTALFILILAVIGLYVRRKVLPRFKGEISIWVGGAIGRFMQDLSKKAEEEGIEAGGDGAPGSIKLGGFEIDVGTVQTILGIVQTLQSMGILKAPGGGGTTENPFLK